MKRCRCCRQEWPLEFFTVCRPDGLRRSTCMACRKGCRPGSRVARNRAYRAHLRASVEQVRLARARATWDNGNAGTSTNRIPYASTPYLLLVPAGAASSRSEGRD